MIVRRHLLRQGRTLFNSTTSTASSNLVASHLPRIQTRCFRLEDIHLNLPPSAYGKSFEELLKEGVLNENVAQWLHRKQLNEQIGTLGARAEGGYEPHRLITHPPTVDEVTLELLLASQAHLGHATSLWHPGNARYIFGIREGVHIISLEATAAHLRRAAKVVHSVADRAGLILFVGTRKGQERAVVGAAKRAGGCHMFDRWIPGTLTNGARILERCEKKVIDQKDRHLTGFEEQLAPMGSLKPDLVVCLNPVENYVLLHECALHNIPTIGVVDTNCNPTWVTYPIPANDDSLRSVQVIVGVLGQAAQTGRKERLARAEEEDEVIEPKPHSLVLPEEYDADAGGKEEGEVIDLRNLKTGNRVRFAEPPKPQQKRTIPKATAEEKLQSLYEQDQTTQKFQNSRGRKVKKEWDIFSQDDADNKAILQADRPRGQ